ncbi:MAG: hypothetical protein L0K41_02715 [Yaniella sp.]|nr:hypothetical protein [Yaniella sp.]MDN6498177.1 hypothetical protein [Yaniella sp.]
MGDLAVGRQPKPQPVNTDGDTTEAVSIDGLAEMVEQQWVTENDLAAVIRSNVHDDGLTWNARKQSWTQGGTVADETVVFRHVDDVLSKYRGEARRAGHAQLERLFSKYSTLQGVKTLTELLKFI